MFAAMCRKQVGIFRSPMLTTVTAARRGVSSKPPVPPVGTEEAKKAPTSSTSSTNSNNTASSAKSGTSSGSLNNPGSNASSSSTQTIATVAAHASAIAGSGEVVTGLTSESEPTKSARQKRQSKTRKPKENDATNKNDVKTASKYISFEDFPSIPKDLVNPGEGYLNSLRLTRGFYPLNSEPITSNFINQDKSNKESESATRLYHDFYIPSHHIKRRFYGGNEADRLLNELSDYIPSELSEIHGHGPHVEHPLKRSWSKLIPINSALHSISNEYLWELVPESKFFKSPPFGAKYITSLDGFEKWEKIMKEKAKERVVKDMQDQQETRNAIHEFNESKSFVSSQRNGGRKKLNRKLVKTFRKLQNEGKLGKKDDENDK